MGALLNAAVAAAVAAFLIGRFCDPASRFHVLDRPNARSLHDNPTPRSGGLGIMLGVAVAWMLGGAPLAQIVIPAFALAFVSLVDDARHLPIAARFGAHILAAALVAVTSGIASVWWLPAVLAVGWMTNLYNFMDGSDGLAGGMALFGFSTYSAAATLGGADDMALLSLSIAAAAGAFLAFNFHPARIFMATSVRFRSASLPGPWAWRAGTGASGRCGFRSWCSPVHRRCQRHPGASGPAWRAGMGGAS